MGAATTSGALGGGLRRMRDIRYVFASRSTLQTDSPRCSQYLRDAHQIVGGGGQDEEPFDQPSAAMPGLAQGSDGHPNGSSMRLRLIVLMR